MEPVLRHFGATKKLARQRFELFVRAGIRLGHRDEHYPTEERRILGPEEFVEKTKKRVGEIVKEARLERKNRDATDLEGLIEAVGKASGLIPEEFCSRRKTRAIVMAKEAVIVLAREMGASNAAVAKLIGIDSSAVSRRFESGKTRMKATKEMQDLVTQIRKLIAPQSS
jgi:chromosomal replication initiation ATPase DnaA